MKYKELNKIQKKSLPVSAMDWKENERTTKKASYVYSDFHKTEIPRTLFYKTVSIIH